MKFPAKTALNSAPMAVKSQPKAKYAAREIVCQTYPHKRFEFLIKVVGEVAYVGAKRKAPALQSGGKATMPPAAIGGNYELINGTTWECMFCSNSVWFACSCGCWFCDESAKMANCPECKKRIPPELKNPKTDISASERQGGHKRLAGKAAKQAPQVAETTRKLLR